MTPEEYVIDGRLFVVGDYLLIAAHRGGYLTGRVRRRSGREGTSCTLYVPVTIDAHNEDTTGEYANYYLPNRVRTSRENFAPAAAMSGYLDDPLPEREE